MKNTIFKTQLYAQTAILLRESYWVAKLTWPHTQTISQSKYIWKTTPVRIGVCCTFVTLMKAYKKRIGQTHACKHPCTYYELVSHEMRF